MEEEVGGLDTESPVRGRRWSEVRESAGCVSPSGSYPSEIDPEYAPALGLVETLQCRPVQSAGHQSLSSPWQGKHRSGSRDNSLEGPPSAQCSHGCFLRWLQPRGLASAAVFLAKVKCRVWPIGPLGGGGLYHLSQGFSPFPELQPFGCGGSSQMQASRLLLFQVSPSAPHPASPQAPGSLHRPPSTEALGE